MKRLSTARRLWLCSNMVLRYWKQLNVMEAQLILDSIIPDPIFLDWILSKITGDKWTHRLKSNDNYRNLPHILVIAKGKTAGGYMTKPFSKRINSKN